MRHRAGVAHHQEIAHAAAIFGELDDLIVDLVATGTTLREHDLVVVEEIAESTARFVVNPVRFRAKYDALTALLERLTAVPA